MNCLPSSFSSSASTFTSSLFSPSTYPLVSSSTCSIFTSSSSNKNGLFSPGHSAFRHYVSLERRKTQIQQYSIIARRPESLGYHQF